MRFWCVLPAAELEDKFEGHKTRGREISWVSFQPRDALEILKYRVEEQKEGKEGFRHHLGNKTGLTGRGEGELAWGAGWKGCRMLRPRDRQPSLISEKTGKDGVTCPRCVCPQLERSC